MGKAYNKETIIKAGMGLFFIGLAWIIANTRCKDPNDFKPPEDTLQYPPIAPNIIQPADSYVFMNSVLPIYVHLEWDTVSGSEVYQCEITYENYEPNINTFDRNYYDITFISDTKFGSYTWRVRAGSANWVGGYTGWSEKRIFKVRYRPRAPVLIYPHSGDTLFYDSLPDLIQLQWDTVSEAQYYEIEIYKKNFILINDQVNINYYNFEFDDTSKYDWRVRAGSSHWQLKTNWSGFGNFYVYLN